MNDFSEKLKALRKEKELTQKELAEQLGYTQSNISEWEKGTVEPKLTALRTIALFFNVSTDYLLGRTDEFGSIVTSPLSNRERLTDNERILLNWYRALPTEKARSAFLSFVTSSSGEAFTTKRN